MKYLIRNATLVNEGKVYQASVLIEQGVIRKIVPPHKFISTNAKIINAVGLFLLPGIIDTHVHFRDPGFEYKGDFQSESKAAAAGGVTSVIDMPNTQPQTLSEETLDAKLKLASEKSWVNFGCMAGASNGGLTDIFAIPKNKYAGIKLFLGASTGNMLVDNEDTIRELFSKSSKVITAHCEDEKIIRENTEQIKNKYGDNPPAFCHALIRNTDACYAATVKAAEYAKKGKAHLHIAHLSAQKELDFLRKLNCKNITAEVCVNYLWFCDQDYERFGGKLKCNPAVKTENDRQALIKGLGSSLLYTIGTDHAPHLLKEKNQAYFSAPSGIPSIQFSLQMMLELYHQGLVSLETIVEKMCHNPARLFQIEKRGFIKEGYYADLVLLDLYTAHQVRAENILYKCGWSLLEGTVFHSKIHSTFINGVLIYHDGRFQDFHSGRALSFYDNSL